MSRSSEVLFFFNRYRMSWRISLAPFSLLSWPGCCLLSTTAQHIKKMGGFFPAGPYRASSFTKVYLYSVYRQLILDGPRSHPDLVLGQHLRELTRARNILNRRHASSKLSGADNLRPPTFTTPDVLTPSMYVHAYNS